MLTLASAASSPSLSCSMVFYQLGQLGQRSVCYDGLDVLYNATGCAVDVPHVLIAEVDFVCI